MYVDRVIEQLEARRPFEDRPQVPGLIDDDADVDVDERPERALRHQVPQREQPGLNAAGN